MRHIKIYEEYTDEELQSLLGSLRDIGLAPTPEEERMRKFIGNFGGGKDPEEYAESLYDYYEHPEEYDIDTEGEYYDMICDLYESIAGHARFDFKGPMSHGNYARWNTTGIAEDPLYKLYLKMSNVT